MEAIEHLIKQPTVRRHQTPLLLQHGAWHGAWCWQSWMDYFASLGYEVHAISLPGHGNSPLHKQHINLYTLNDYVEILGDRITAIFPTPVVIGHSLGGAILQKYLERHQLPGAVLLASLPATGMLGMIFRLLRHHPVEMLTGLLTTNTYHWVGTPELAQELFLSADTTVDVHQLHRQLVKESYTVGLQILLTFAKINIASSPVLTLSGARDVIFTLDEEKATADKYKTELVVFKGQAHNLMMEPASQEVANTIDHWITDTLKLA
jgi:pimeloyl-ACP methyl ester carboxylesterase